ncbi:hypothetical protein UFOVP1077_51 [uncultured Caudovirales phage]|uniref:Uncharacterized protein n=1 Tax=uncultured Caudovirales phage TaxID=2100421 RepID=A0A6J5QP90_9CAUD|nr:hypothetical protein UFOVP1077_51 [uncultured Caudovirales phage]CAB4197920.1 hypothetical protein UFOVP1316_39 [uncultured Caudovirales phage]CAB4211442.1 hypothetical protein UFOVP1428_48 [uncultured Caudovirales phage]CAB5227506.1 hypothetical protein UFOVP1526_51 [uncultured Caudovirales phage]
MIAMFCLVAFALAILLLNDVYGFPQRPAILKLGRLHVLLWNRWAVRAGAYPNIGVRPIFKFWIIGPVEFRWFTKRR